jgi:lysophospholipase
MVLGAPMIALHGRGMSSAARSTIKALRTIGAGSSYIPGGGATAVTSLPFFDNDLTSDAVRYARTGAIVEAEPALALGSPTVAWLDAAYTTMADFAEPEFPRGIHQPILIIAAGQDTVVSTVAIEQFAIRLRAGAHVVITGARHEILMEQDYYRGQFWAAFDAFVPGTPIF